MPDCRQRVEAMTFTYRRPLRRSIYTISREGDGFRCHWHNPVVGIHPGGLFRTFEDARKSLWTVAEVPEAKRVVEGCIAEFAGISAEGREWIKDEKARRKKAKA